MMPKDMANSQQVTINVGGVKHDVHWCSLERFPISRLGQLRECNTHEAITQLCDDYSLEDNEYFFERHPDRFNAILNQLNLYNRGKLHLVEDMCVLAFSEDLEYWGVNELYLEPCCRYKYQCLKDNVYAEIRNEEKGLQKEVEDFGLGKCAKSRKWLWNLLENPDSSSSSKVFAVISTLIIMVSTADVIVDTLPEMQMHDMDGVATEHPVLTVVESLCIAWFTLEYVLRFSVAPDKWKFVKGRLNMIDLLSIVPCYMSRVLSAATIITASGEARQILEKFRILRMIRIIKIARHAIGLRALGHTLRHSYTNFGLLVNFLWLGVLLFSLFEYFAEKEVPETQFKSMPATFWWACITMTTIGYGDMCPTTLLGKCIGAVTCVTGVLFISLPIPLLVRHFCRFRNALIRQNKAMRRLEDLKRIKCVGYDVLSASDPHRLIKLKRKQ